MATKLVKRLIPDRFFPMLIDIKNNLFGKFKKSYYSQFGEDVVINRLLRENQGFYVDVGAYHPKHLSNTYLLFKKGWRGINIDPNPYAIRLFKKYRKNDINLAVGISRESAIRTFFLFSHSNWNTFSAAKAAEWKKRIDVRYLGERRVECLPIRAVLDQYFPKDAAIGLMNIDVEGLDLEVLESNDWAKYRPKVIVIECANFDAARPELSAVYLFLTKQDYRLFVFLGLSLIFVRND